MKKWSKYKAHNAILVKINDPCELFDLFVEAMSEMDRMRTRWPNGSRSLYCAQGWLAGIEARSIDLDEQNDLGIR